jgi:hypothetical protein
MYIGHIYYIYIVVVVGLERVDINSEKIAELKEAIRAWHISSPSMESIKTGSGSTSQVLSELET